MSEKTLHKSVMATADAIWQLHDHRSDHVGRCANRFATDYRELRMEGTDVIANLSLAIDGTVFFAGSIRGYDVYSRGKVTLALGLVAATEILYLQLIELAMRNKRDVRLTLGVFEIDGNITDVDTVMGVIRSLHMQGQGQGPGQRPEGDCGPAPGMDGEVLFGAFPGAGFRHFYGDAYKLVE